MRFQTATATQTGNPNRFWVSNSETQTETRASQWYLQIVGIYEWGSRTAISDNKGPLEMEVSVPQLHFLAAALPMPRDGGLRYSSAVQPTPTPPLPPQEGRARAHARRRACARSLRTR